MAKRSGINRSLMWLRKVFEVTEETESPQVVGELLRPVVDVFGWERLPEEQFEIATAAQPATAVASSGTPVDVLRLVLHASLRHTDTGVNHVAWVLKRRNPGPFNIGLPNDRVDIDATEHLSVIGHTFLVEGDFLIGEVIGAPVAGSLSLATNFIDLPIGEYFPPL